MGFPDIRLGGWPGLYLGGGRESIAPRCEATAFMLGKSTGDRPALSGGGPSRRIPYP